jgi:hypothetical protein
LAMQSLCFWDMNDVIFTIPMALTMCGLILKRCWSSFSALVKWWNQIFVISFLSNLICGFRSCLKYSSHHWKTFHRASQDASSHMGEKYHQVLILVWSSLTSQVHTLWLFPGPGSYLYICSYILWADR